MKEDMEPTSERTFVAKKRQCLKCRDSFESSWVGERVCRRCKSNDGWRSGSMVTTEYTVTRRR